MDAFADAVAGALLALGAAAGVLAGLGLLRFPDFYTRVHAGGVGDTGCAGLVLVGLAVHSGVGQNTLKLLLILGFLWLTSATAAHSLVKAARHAGVEPLVEPDDGEEDGGRETGR